MAGKQRIKYNSIKTVLADIDVKNKDLAAYFNLSPQHVSKWVTNTNQPSIQWLFKIASFLKVDVRVLLTPNDPKGDQPDLPVKTSDFRKKID